MGWATGTEICTDIWNLLRPFVPEEKRSHVLSEIIVILQWQDWDTEDEIKNEWPEVDEALALADAYWESRR